MARHNELGNTGEDLALNYLETHQYLIVERNVNLTRGELDIVAREGGDLVFVEVKTRAGNAFGSAAESLTSAKAKSLARAVREYIHNNRLDNESIRLDLVAITLPPGGEPEIDLIRNAIPLGEALGE